MNELTAIPSKENIEITIWRKRKLVIIKSLIPLRIAQFLWFASGSLVSPFFPVLLTQRGLTLTEFSSLFSMISLLQVAIAYVCGIIADKLGNTKPVLVFLMFATISAFIGLLLMPDIRDKSCLEQDINVTCATFLNYTFNFEDCEKVCFTNNTDYFIGESKRINSSNLTLFPERNRIVNSNDTFESSLFSNSTAIFCSEICSCLDQKICSTSTKIKLKIFYSILILLFFPLWSTCYRFIDFISLNVAKQHNSNFGNERFYGVLGKFIVAFLFNFVLSLDKSETRGHYDNLFWCAIVMDILAIISLCNLKIVILQPGLKLTKKTLKLFTNVEIVSVMLVTFAAGIALTFFTTFNLWYLDNLKASKGAIGLYIISDSLYGLPVLATSKWWLKKINRKTAVTICLLCYFVHGISYSFLSNPWLCIVIEITLASFYLFWVKTVVHCREIAPEGFAATVNAIIGTVHFGIGRSFSVPVGGYLISIYGAKITYRILAAFCLVTLILYWTFLYLRHLFSKMNAKKQSISLEEMRSKKKELEKNVEVLQICKLEKKNSI